ncbi:hypothetical protein ADUPG1_005335, partial [Aduncisulcus paluster]
RIADIVSQQDLDRTVKDMVKEGKRRMSERFQSRPSGTEQTSQIPHRISNISDLPDELPWELHEIVSPLRTMENSIPKINAALATFHRTHKKKRSPHSHFHAKCFKDLKQAINPISPATAPTPVIAEYVEKYTEESESIDIPPSRFTETKLRINSVTIKEVYVCLKGLNSAAGPDGMTAKAARTFAPGVWTSLFNCILEKEIIPSQWRHIRAQGIDKENGKPDDDLGRWR